MNPGQDWIVAATMATEVPPAPAPGFPAKMIPLAIAAVAHVIRNRVASPLFPDTAVEVVLQPKQFSAVCRWVTGRSYWAEALAGRWFPRHVLRCLSAWQDPSQPTPVPGALYYYSPVSMVPRDAVPYWTVGKTEIPCPGLDPGWFRFYA